MEQALIGALGAVLILLLGLVLKRVGEIDCKLDEHIRESATVRADVKVLQDRWERK